MEVSTKTDGGDTATVEHTARNGVITAIGILLGFDLSFCTAWSFRPGEWEKKGIVVFALLFVGVLLMTLALYLILEYHLTVGRYKWSTRSFLVGVVLTLAGVFLAIVYTFPW
jgi:hypothetical protein